MDDLEEILNSLELSQPDRFEVSAREEIIGFFESHKETVFYSRQLEVIFEDKYFHWITNRVLRRLTDEAKIKMEKRPLKLGTVITLYWHPTYRYYKRDANKIIGLVDNYSEASNSIALGDHGEHLAMKGLVKFGYSVKGMETNSYNGVTWQFSNHDLDLVIEKDDLAYGVEIKNKLSYIDKEEFDVKVKMCEHLGIKPFFINRMLPKIWIEELREAGGFALIIKYQLYPRFLSEQAKMLREQLMLPIDSPKALEDGTIQRFDNWHEKRVNSK